MGSEVKKLVPMGHGEMVYVQLCDVVALQISHDELVNVLERFLQYWESDFVSVACHDGRTLAEQMNSMTAALARAKRLTK